MKNTTSHKLKMATLSKIDDDYPFVVEVATRNVPKVREKISGDIMYAYLEQWRTALTDKERLKELVLDESTHGYDLWQINPFTGIFSPKERWAILKG